METKKKKGKVHYKKDKMKNPELTFLEGCNGCKKQCVFNRRIVRPNESYGAIYQCNSTRGK